MKKNQLFNKTGKTFLASLLKSSLEDKRVLSVISPKLFTLPTKLFTYSVVFGLKLWDGANWINAIKQINYKIKWN